MGEILTYLCDNCSFSIRIGTWIVMSTGDSDFFSDMYCLDCQKVAKVWHRKKGKVINDKNCPKCKSLNVFIELPKNTKCPNCKKGIFEENCCLYID